jgi:hypothetical protein
VHQSGRNASAPGSRYATALASRGVSKVGLTLPDWTAPPAGTPYWWVTELEDDTSRWHTMLALARQAEAAGCDSLCLVDHLLLRWAPVNEQFGWPVPANQSAHQPQGQIAICPYTARGYVPSKAQYPAKRPGSGGRF